MSNRDLRAVLHSGHSYVRSQETNKAVASWTLDHMISAQIRSMKKGETRELVDAAGESVGNRISRYDQLTELEESITKAVSAIKEAGSDSDKLRVLGVYEVDEVED